MKLYISSILPKTLVRFLSQLTNICNVKFNSKKCEIVSKTDGIFLIENDIIYSIETEFNSKLELIKDYRFNNKRIDLLVDKNKTTKTQVVSKLPTSYVSSTYVEFSFKLHLKSYVTLVIECYEDTDTMTGITEHIPFNFYFISDLEINDLSIQDEINVFLSIITNI